MQATLPISGMDGALLQILFVREMAAVCERPSVYATISQNSLQSTQSSLPPHHSHHKRQFLTDARLNADTVPLVTPTHLHISFVNPNGCALCFLTRCNFALTYRRPSGSKRFMMRVAYVRNSASLLNGKAPDVTATMIKSCPSDTYRFVFSCLGIIWQSLLLTGGCTPSCTLFQRRAL